MRYLTLAEAMVIAESVTGIDAKTLARASQLDLLDSALMHRNTTPLGTQPRVGVDNIWW